MSATNDHSEWQFAALFIAAVFRLLDEESLALSDLLPVATAVSGAERLLGRQDLLDDHAFLGPDLSRFLLFRLFKDLALLLQLLLDFGLFLDTPILLRAFFLAFNLSEWVYKSLGGGRGGSALGLLFLNLIFVSIFCIFSIFLWATILRYLLCLSYILEFSFSNFLFNNLFMILRASTIIIVFLGLVWVIVATDLFSWLLLPLSRFFFDPPISFECSLNSLLLLFLLIYALFIGSFVFEFTSLFNYFPLILDVTLVGRARAQLSGCATLGWRCWSFSISSCFRWLLIRFGRRTFLDCLLLLFIFVLLNIFNLL